MKEGAIGDDISFEMQYVADKDDFFKKRGLKTEEVNTSSGVTATQALILKAISKGAKLRIIAPDIETFPYLLVSGKSITSPPQLKGKAVGISQVGSSSYYGSSPACRHSACRKAPSPSGRSVARAHVSAPSGETGE